MSNKAAYGPGSGAIGSERVGPWRTQLSDPMHMGAPFVLSTSGTYDWLTEYGVVYKITICGAGAGGASAGASLNGGSGAGTCIFWWVGTGERATIVVPGAVGPGTSGGNGTFSVGGKTPSPHQAA